MRRMSKVELTKDYEERAIKKDIAVVKTRACTIF
jgi:ribosomal protein L29